MTKRIVVQQRILLGFLRCRPSHPSSGHANPQPHLSLTLRTVVVCAVLLVCSASRSIFPALSSQSPQRSQRRHTFFQVSPSSAQCLTELFDPDISQSPLGFRIQEKP